MNSAGDQRWTSTLSLPYTSDNEIWYWKKRDFYEFSAKIATTTSTLEGRIKTKDFIELVEKSLGAEWEKNISPSDDVWDAWVTFHNGSTVIQIISQKYKKIDSYEAKLNIMKRNI